MIHVIHTPSSSTLDEMNISSWPIWEKEPSQFPWHYDAEEICYLLEGKVTVNYGEGQSISFGKGDMVTFEKGLSCEWIIHEDVKKHYQFR